MTIPTLKFGAITHQHAEWLSNNRLADPVTGCNSDGYLLSALLSGFHANFDGSYMEEAAPGGSTVTGIVDTLGDIPVCDSTALNTLAPVLAVAKGRFFVSDGVATTPKYAAAPNATAGALVAAGAGTDLGYVEPVAAGQFLVSAASNTKPKFVVAGTNNSFPLGNTAADPTFLAPGTANQVLKGVGAATAPAWKTVDYSGTTSATGEIVVTDMTATGAVVVTPLENLGAGIVLSHVVCGGGLITVYSKDILDINVALAPAVNAKKFAVHVIKLS